MQRTRTYTGDYLQWTDINEPTTCSFIIVSFMRSNSNLVSDKPVFDDVIAKYQNAMSSEAYSLDIMLYVLSNKLTREQAFVETFLVHDNKKYNRGSVSNQQIHCPKWRFWWINAILYDTKIELIRWHFNKFSWSINHSQFAFLKGQHEKRNLTC